LSRIEKKKGKRENKRKGTVSETPWSTGTFIGPLLRIRSFRSGGKKKKKKKAPLHAKKGANTTGDTIGGRPLS